jgi:hypothetical protein
MVVHIVESSINGNSRIELRRNVVNLFLQEEPGTGKGPATSRYIYYVEKIANGNRIYLTRPAYLNKGFDFVVAVENTSFSSGRNVPSQEDVFRDLVKKKKENPSSYERLYRAICSVYDCKSPEDELKALNDLKFTSGFSIELLLKVIKWLLIEQDVTYWNWSGRSMFKSRVDEI